MEVALDVRGEDAVQCYYLVAERAGGALATEWVPLTEEVEDAHWVGLWE
jgi:hypothetical protein